MSTLSLSFFKPVLAYSILLPPSETKGTVTTPTVNMPFSFANLATTGAAPVPVPPPIPAVMNNIFVFESNNLLIISLLSSAALSPISGLAPAPKPEVNSTPICILLGTGLISKACKSVLQITKSTPFIPDSYM